MKRAITIALILAAVVGSASMALAQLGSNVESTTLATTVPRLVKFAGTVKGDAGKPRTGVVGATFALYKDQDSGAALWIETQNVQLDLAGHYTVLLGSTKPDGLPAELFTSGEARWLGIQPEGQAEQPRVLLLSVPYALKAGDAETVGGLPASAFMRTAQPGESAAAPASENATPNVLPPAVRGNGTVNFLPIWTGKNLVANSTLVQVGSNLGIGNNAPATTLDVNGTATIRGAETVTGMLNVANTVTSQDAIHGTVSGTVGIGLYGQGGSLVGTGVYGYGPIGMQGYATMAQGVGGVFGNAFGGPILEGVGASGTILFNVDGAGNVSTASLKTGNISAFDIQAAKVGIGFSAPQATLDVAGNGVDIYAGDPQCGGSGTAAIGFGNSGFANCGNYALRGDNGGNLYINSNSTGWMFFDHNNTGLMSLDPSGNLSIAGNLSKGGGSFKIDHPLDPANKYLYHSFVESPDMMNIYNGNVITDSHGRATITLPEYFEALNRDFRYQLTVVGQFAQAIVLHKVQKNHFTIKTNKPGVEVSWQVTGIRQDPWANAHRIPNEVEKPAGERGTYLHPELYEAATP